MNKEMTSSKFIKTFLVFCILLLVLCGGITMLFDPFYHYHKPLPHLKAVLTDKEYQVPGTLDHFDYDAVIAGSSVAENNNNRWYDETFDCKSVKAIRSYGATADLVYYLDRAFEHRYIKYVFLNLDPSSLTADPDNTTFESVGAPMYLYDQNPINDVRYLWNKDVIFKKIPYLLANSFIGNYDEGTSYNWAQWKAFDEETALYHYIQSPKVLDMNPEDTYHDICDQNVSLITDMVIAHPDTEFYIFLPPYSVLWWDSLYREGDTDAYISMEERAFRTLLKYENIHLYNFQDDIPVTTDLENYTDSLHFSPKINEYICHCMKDKKFLISNEEDLENSFGHTKMFSVAAPSYVKNEFGDRIKVDIIPENGQ
ncbi:MAG: SGNH/GDSL hydrolase family protein [Lachnospiraceae bacterium]|nr:SGNH/GDSL hydrolase family protein [Lachnospiraceae bacterium]